MQDMAANLDSIYTKRFKDFSCGTCVIDTRDNFSIIFANQAFYKMINTDAEEMKLRFGNCLETLISSEYVRKLKEHIQAGNSFEMELCIRNNVCLHAMFNCTHLEESSIVYMICFDTTLYKQQSMDLEKLLLKLDYIFTQTKCDIFEYEKETSYVVFSSSKIFFNGITERVKLPQYFIDTGKINFESLKDIQYCFQIIQNGGENTSCEFKISINEKDEKWVRLILDSHTSGDGLILCILVDITAEKEATTKYLEEMIFYQAILSDRDAYGHFDITEDRALMFGGLWNLYNEVSKTNSYSEIFMEFIDKVVHSEDRARYKETMECHTIIDSYNKGIMHMAYEFRRIVEQNKMVWMKISIHIIKNPFNQHIMALMYIKNIDREKKRLLELTFRDENDTLTGIYNRKAIESKIKEYLLLRNLKKNSIFVFIDIDDFNVLNKKYGIVKGDEILKSISTFLVETFAKDNIIGRFGGDEFLLLIRDSEDTDGIVKKIEKVFEKVKKQHEIVVTCCIGISNITATDTYEYAFQKVISALIEAKTKGKKQNIIYKNEMLDEDLVQLHQQNIKEYGDTFLKSSQLNELQDTVDEVMGVAGEIAYIVDPDSLNLLSGNQVFCDRLGKSLSECVGRKCYELMHKRTTPCPFCKKENWRDDKFFMYRDFNKVLQQEFLIKNKLVEIKERTLLLAIAVDLSNKTIVDSIDHGTTENNTLLNGLKRMQNSSSLDETLKAGLESIYDFFRANSVRFWKWDKETEEFYFNNKWSYPRNVIHYNEQECHYIGEWLKKQTRNKNLLRIESQEYMLTESVEIYHMMKKNDINNQAWYVLDTDEEIDGFIEIDGVSINYQNETFLKSFAGFLQNELKKRRGFDELLYNSYYDKLTGLMNRNSYDEFLQRFDKDKVDNMSVIFMNLNQMTKINNESGTNYGDNILIEFSKIIKSVFYDANIFRLNGDEFMITNENVAVQHVEENIEKIKKVVGEIGTFTVSVGYAWDNLDKNFNELVTLATQSMEIHKQRYYDGLENLEDNHYEELNKLIVCIDNHEFEVYLQAKVNSKSNKLFGAEALIRYIHKDFGVIAPSKFIPIVEKKNMIRYIDLFVFDEVCKCLDKWKKEGLFCPVISLNFSRKTLLEDHLIDIMNETVKKYQIDKKNIEIEITEGAADVGTAVVYQIVKRIREAGYAISLDDFGTNYTNLSILSELDFDTLKLDRSLIYSLNTQKKNKIILKNMIQMCEQLGVEVIAEGVETIEQRDTLKELGCIYIQGYLYSKPTPIGEFEEKFIYNHK